MAHRGSVACLLATCAVVCLACVAPGSASAQVPGSGTVGGAVGGVTNGVGQAVGGVTEGVGGATGGVTDTVGGVTDGLDNATGGAVGGVTESVGGVTESVGGVTERVGGVTERVTGGGNPAGPASGVVDGATEAVGGSTGASPGSRSRSSAPSAPSAPGSTGTSSPGSAPAAAGGPGAVDRAGSGAAARSPAVGAVAHRRGAKRSRARAARRRDRRPPEVRRRAYERRLRHSVDQRVGCFYVLSDLEQSVLVLRGGVGREPRSRGQVARRLGLERERVRASERSGLRALRREDRETGCSGEASSAVGAVVSGAATGGPFGPLVAAASTDSGGLFSERGRGVEGGPGEAERGTGGVAGERDSGGSALDSIKPNIGPIDTTGESAFPFGLALLVLLVLAGAFALIVAPRLTRPNR